VREKESGCDIKEGTVERAKKGFFLQILNHFTFLSKNHF
jgi:hypothetical protein